MRGRDYVLPEDIQAVYTDVVAHRLILTPSAQAKDRDGAALCGEVLHQVKPPRLR